MVVVWGSFPGHGGLKETKMFLSHPLVKLSIVGSLRDREVACSASDLQGLNFESCVWRAVSSHSSHHPQEFILAQKWPKARLIAFHYQTLKAQKALSPNYLPLKAFTTPSSFQCWTTQLRYQGIVNQICPIVTLVTEEGNRLSIMQNYIKLQRN